MMIICMLYSKSTGGFYNTEVHGENIPHDCVEISYEEYISLIKGQSRGLLITSDDNGFPILQDRMQITAADELEVLVLSIQKHLDSTAFSVGYDDIRTAVTYADEPSVPKYQMEGIAFRAWRSKVWDYIYTQFAAYKSGERENPGVDGFIKELPELEIQNPNSIK